MHRKKREILLVTLIALVIVFVAVRYIGDGQQEDSNISGQMIQEETSANAEENDVQLLSANMSGQTNSSNSTLNRTSFGKKLGGGSGSSGGSSSSSESVDGSSSSSTPNDSSDLSSGDSSSDSLGSGNAESVEGKDLNFNFGVGGIK